MADGLPPPPQSKDAGFDRWMNILYTFVRTGSSTSTTSASSSSTTTAITDHNLLDNLQGGKQGEEYHLTSAQNALLPTGTPIAGQVPMATSSKTSSWHNLPMMMQGVDGEDGQDGFNGQQGIQGIQGINGQHGTDGQDGEDGIFIMQPSVQVPSYSAGTYTSPTYTDNGNGTVTLSSGQYVFYANAIGELPLSKFTIAGATYTLTDNATNYLIANLNGGSPTITASTTNTSNNDTTIYTIARVQRTGLDLDILDYNAGGLALSNKLLMRTVNTIGVSTEKNGFVLSEAATRLVIISSGYVWAGVKRASINAFTSATDELSYYYHVAGVWTKGVLTAYNNTQYDDGTTLQTLSPSKYAVNWIFKSATSAGLTNESYLVLGGGNYNLAQAQASTVPANLPTEITSTGFIVGRIIVLQGASTATQIDSAFTTSLNFSPSTTATGLQSLTTIVDVSAATAPLAGQVLTAISPTAATWQTPSGGAGSVGPQGAVGQDGTDGEDSYIQIQPMGLSFQQVATRITYRF